MTSLPGVFTGATEQPGVKLLFNISYKYDRIIISLVCLLAIMFPPTGEPETIKLSVGLCLSLCCVSTVCPVCVSLLFVLDGFLCQREVRLKKSNNALAKTLLRDSAEWSLTMPPPTGRQMALARKKPSFVIWNQKRCGAYLHWCK